MRKLHCHICDGCRKVLGDGFCRIIRAGKAQPLDLCRPCYDEYVLKQLVQSGRRLARTL